MNIHLRSPRVSCCLAAVVMAVAGSATPLKAATTLGGRLEFRTVTPQDIKDYGLTGLQGASGLETVGLGQPVYLDALVNVGVAGTDVTNVSWSLTKPLGSSAELAASPLGDNVPTYRMADRLISKVAGRKMLRPDAAGQYSVSLTIDSATYGSTNITRTVNAGTYMGINTCKLCHSGGQIAPNKYDSWVQTKHASKFTRGINGFEGDHYGKNCISCHTVGYDANTNAVNGGFDDIALQLGWTFPAVLSPTNWDAVPPQLQNLANIQCENCHGPGSQHAYSLGDPDKISVTFDAGDCGQCHDSKNNHYRSAEWNNSSHAVATRTPTGPNRPFCARCHTGGGFADYLDHLGDTNTYTTNTLYTAITCSTCHDPHDASNPHQLRATETVTLNEGTTITTGGAGATCMNCHQSRTGSYKNSLEKYPIGLATWQGGSSFGPHDNPAADMLNGVNGYTYGKDIPSSAHRFAVEDTCVHCHMQTVAATNSAFTKAGGHTFRMSYDVVNQGVTNTVDLVNVCTGCHGPIDSFDVPREDYNGDGVIEGVQTEVQHLLDKLTTLMPNSTWRADGNYVADGLVKSSVSAKTNWPAKYLQAGWNFQFVNNDHSKGIHNAAYAVGLLKASIADLTGDANNDGLPDSWQIQYFGSANNPSAAPGYSAAGDGVPNWIKYSLGIDPTVPGTVVPNGVVWADGKNLLNPQGSDGTLAIYTAAEVVFNTEVGKTYQIQAASSVSSGWQNVGAPIAGTGAPFSYVSPTRTGVQQFYRVVKNP